MSPSSTAVETEFDPVHRLGCREHLQSCIAVPDPDVDLGRAALWLAAEEYPELRVERYLSRLDDLGRRLAMARGHRGGMAATVGALHRVLVEEEGLQGNLEEYYDPRNIYLNEVLDRRIGLPLSLSIVYLEAARRAGIKMEGVGMPGHFLVRVLSDDGAVFLDPFYRGEILDREDCAERLHELYGPDITLSEEHLEGVGARGILVRMLYNLRRTYLEEEDYARALAALERVALVAGESARLRCERGLLLAQLQMYGSALADLAAGLGPTTATSVEADLEPAGDDDNLHRQLEWVRRLAAAPN